MSRVSRLCERKVRASKPTGPKPRIDFFVDVLGDADPTKLTSVIESLGRLSRALAWDRDAYGLKLTTRRSLRAQLLVNARRAHRAKEAFKRLRSGRTD
jgi:hypothetical protein